MHIISQQTSSHQQESSKLRITYTSPARRGQGRGAAAGSSTQSWSSALSATLFASDTNRMVEHCHASSAASGYRSALIAVGLEKPNKTNISGQDSMNSHRCQGQEEEEEDEVWASILLPKVNQARNTERFIHILSRVIFRHSMRGSWRKWRHIVILARTGDYQKGIRQIAREEAVIMIIGLWQSLRRKHLIRAMKLWKYLVLYVQEADAIR